MPRLVSPQLAIAMGEKHRAAPSEHQILEALLELLDDSDTTSRERGLGTDLCSVLTSALPVGLKRKARKNLWVVDIVDVALPSRPGISSGAKRRAGIQSSHENKPCGQPTFSSFDLSDVAYSKPCVCCGEKGQETGPLGGYVILLCRATSMHAPSDKETVDSLLSEWYKEGEERSARSGDAAEKGKEKEKRRHRYRRCTLAGAEGTSMITPHSAITVCQHFAYHGRLLAAIKEGTKL